MATPLTLDEECAAFPLLVVLLKAVLVALLNAAIIVV
jgi:hypothetical protein